MNYNFDRINNYFREKKYEKCVLNLYKLLNDNAIPIQDELILRNNYLFCSIQLLYSNDEKILQLCENTSTKYLSFIKKLERNYNHLTIRFLLTITNNILWWFYIVPFDFNFYDNIFHNLIQLIISILIKGLKNTCNFIHYSSYTSHLSKFINIIKLFVNNISCFHDEISDILTLLSLLALHISDNKCFKLLKDNYFNIISELDYNKLIKGKLKTTSNDLSKLYPYSFQENVQYENILDYFILIISYSFLRLGIHEKAINILEKYNESSFYTNSNLLFFQGYFLFINSKYEESENIFKLIENKHDDDDDIIKNYNFLIKSFILAKKGKLKEAEDIINEIKKNKLYELISLHYQIKIHELLSDEINYNESLYISYLNQIINLLQINMESNQIEIIKSFKICILKKLENEEINLYKYTFKITNIYLNRKDWLQVELKMNDLLKYCNKNRDAYENYYKYNSYIYQCCALAIFHQNRFKDAEEMINNSLAFLNVNESFFQDIKSYYINILCSSIILYKILYLESKFEEARKILQRALYNYEKSKINIESTLIDALLARIWLEKAKYSIEKKSYSDTIIFFQKALFTNCKDKEILYEYIHYKLTKTSSLTRFDLTLFEKLIKMNDNPLTENPIYNYILNSKISEEDIQKLLILSTSIKFEEIS